MVMVVVVVWLECLTVLDGHGNWLHGERHRQGSSLSIVVLRMWGPVMLMMVGLLVVLRVMGVVVVMVMVLVVRHVRMHMRRWWTPVGPLKLCVSVVLVAPWSIQNAFALTLLTWAF
uniref:Uncharacterized protein n=1 Tax=Eutreptiella gymnastica TaxID=73025 RepID=A0A7S4GAT1_9EUGL